MKIAVTTGDLDGIGLEIALKALKALKLPKSHTLALWGGEDFALTSQRRLPKLKIIKSLQAADGPGLFFIASKESPAKWVEISGKACLQGDFDALVTGPLSKPEIQRAGYPGLGHTEILSRLSGTPEVFMSFWGRRFNVALLTGHVPLAKTPETYTAERLVKLTQLLRQNLPLLDSKRSKRPLAFLGLNPHAGDQGLIGLDESRLLKELPSGFLGRQNLEGPLPGDSAFIAPHLKRYAAFIAGTHDQGLIAFKMAHGFNEGVHVTLGLPFLRTSVDHGPAKDLFGKNKADAGSMRAALELALNYRSNSLKKGV